MTDFRHYDDAFTPDGERNPFYPQPIVPDAIHHGPIHDHRPYPRPRSVSIEENIKVAEIKDAFQNLRYKVSLTSFDSCHHIYRKEYQIQVIAYFQYKDPLVIVSIPEYGHHRIYEYDEALKIYNDYVANYTHLIKAETKDFQDVSLYKEQIGYKMTMPKCCYTCKWCKKHPFEVECQIGVVGKLECHNPKCNKAYTFDDEHRHSPWHEHCHDPSEHAPNWLDYGRMHLDIHPNVDMFGICDNYESMKHEYRPLPTDCIADLINDRVDWRVAADVPPVVENVISTELTSQLSAPFTQAVTTVLSGPEASTALSVPVVKIVAENISADPLSTEMIDVVASGITIEKIVGNNGLRKFNDKNNNGFQDDDEPDIEEDEIVFDGGLGA